MVTLPGANAESTGGSSVDKLTTAVLLELHARPVTVCPVELTACKLRESPTSIFKILGAIIDTVPPDPPVILNASALLSSPFETCTRATPLIDPDATVAVIAVSLQFTTVPAAEPSLTWPVPCVAPKPVPARVTVVPAPAVSGLTLTRFSEFTMNSTTPLAAPLFKTCTTPDFDPAATCATICVALQLCTTPCAVPIQTCPVPWVAPKPLPAIVTVVPTFPVSGETLVIVGEATVNGIEFDHTPDLDTCAVPVATICVSLQLTTFAFVLPSQTMMVPCEAPKPVPVIVTCVPAAPLVGVTVKTTAGITNMVPRLGMPFTVTTTFPLVAPVGTVAVIVVAFQRETDPAAVPLKVTVLVPWLGPKPVPVMVTAVPTGPEFRERYEITGRGTTVKATGLLATPFTVTTTLPLVAEGGTKAVILVALQLDAVPEFMPLNVTVLLPCVAPKLVPLIVIAAPVAPVDGVRLVIVGLKMVYVPLVTKLSVIPAR
jgi:hypothetical protein